VWLHAVESREAFVNTAILDAMQEASDWLEIVCCPSCHARLRRAASERLECSECAAAYPVFDGIPWLYRDVAGSRAQWAAKLQKFRAELLADRAELDSALHATDLLPATRDRLERQKLGLERLGQQIFGLLELFGFAHSEAGGSLPKDRIPSGQHITSYLETVYRDWCWGGEEIRETLEKIEPLLGTVGTADEGGRLLVLGGGAGRFSDEIARRMQRAQVVQLDLNPLLTRIGSLVSRGESVELTEQARFPLGLDHVSVDQRLARSETPLRLSSETDPEDGNRDAPLPLPSPVHFMLGDAFAPPFAPRSFDVLVTPWFVDILPESFRKVSRRLGSLLVEGGRWVSFGPLSFESLGMEDRLTGEEMRQALEEAGFEVEHTAIERVAYLHSPHGMPRRNEEIFVFAAMRRAVRSFDEDYSFYPEWMTDGTRPVPVSPGFEEMRAMRTFDLEILKCIDGRASIEEIVGILSKRYGLEPDRCRNSVNRFFSKMIEGDAAKGR
jgi:uncharacterized protein YbaR (Trm112 family)/SAM-dependent methyltransferase